MLRERGCALVGAGPGEKEGAAGLGAGVGRAGVAGSGLLREEAAGCDLGRGAGLRVWV